MSRTNCQLHCPPLRRNAKSRLVTLVLCGLFFAPAFGARIYADNGGLMATTVDLAVARPISFAATVVGSALFIVSLPVALASHSVKDTAHVLIQAPAKDTFSRPVGDLDDFMSYY